MNNIPNAAERRGTDVLRARAGGGSTLTPQPCTPRPGAAGQGHRWPQC
ncbi:hypothetical protein IW245_002337 [Longispora fulva]|uniref:Uncharacterized protein n=1 Tax=Longispora fulva TaxID=619741 RepID=A0A8J7G9C4_9ACTN|nr:hypothetical protein [Longispora fulva]